MFGDGSQAALAQGLLCWLFKGGFTVSSGTVLWHRLRYRSSYGADFENAEIARPVCERPLGDGPNPFPERPNTKQLRFPVPKTIFPPNGIWDQRPSLDSLGLSRYPPEGDIESTTHA